MLIEIIHQQHQDLRELFARHQETLLQGRFEEAKMWLGHYLASQQTHMQIEERYLFPEFAGIERDSKWGVTVYEKEHNKINQLNEAISQDLDWLSQQEFTPSQLKRNIIALLDKEKTLKGLNEHHEEREQEAMLKELDDKLDALQLKELKLDIKLTWVEAMGAIREAVLSS